MAADQAIERGEDRPADAGGMMQCGRGGMVRLLRRRRLLAQATQSSRRTDQGGDAAAVKPQAATVNGAATAKVGGGGRGRGGRGRGGRGGGGGYGSIVDAGSVLMVLDAGVGAGGVRAECRRSSRNSRGTKWRRRRLRVSRWRRGSGSLRRTRTTSMLWTVE